jgi:hypothetical protein
MSVWVVINFFGIPIFVIGVWVLHRLWPKRHTRPESQERLNTMRNAGSFR